MDPIKSRLQRYIRANFRLINIGDFKLGSAPYNYYCYINAIQKVKEGAAEKVFACYAIKKDKSFQCVHFVNQLSNGTYQDNTWGWEYLQYDYYILKEIQGPEFLGIENLFEDIRYTLLHQNSNWLERLVYKIHQKDL